jgi:tripartite-type tricarboxylate transporter receptor subunit TctC
MKRFKLLFIVVAIFALAGLVMSAEKYPTGPVTYVIPFNAGGQSDVEARLQQPFLEKDLGVPIVITYMPGAGGGLAWTKFAQAKPDGYTICGINVPHIVLQPLCQADVAFKTQDINPVCIFESTPIGLAVKKGSSVNSVKEFIEFAKANPGKATVGMSGKFSGHHMAALQFMKMTGIKLTLVTFTGAAPQITNLLGGHVEAIFGNSSDLVTYQTQIKVLAIGSEKPMEQLPGVPTFEEEGFKFFPRIDRGVAVPKGTPPDIAARLEKVFLDTVNTDNYRSKIVSAGFVPLCLNSEQSKKYIAEQIEICEQLLKEHDLLLKK